VSLIAADMLLGHERRWHGLSQEGTAAFFNNSKPRMLVLLRMELNGGDGCCSMKSVQFVDNICHDTCLCSGLHFMLMFGWISSTFSKTYGKAKIMLSGCCSWAAMSSLIPVLAYPFFTTTIRMYVPIKTKTGAFMLLYFRGSPS
jgi:hypothetical protein